MFELTDFNKVNPDHKPIRGKDLLNSAPVVTYGGVDEDDYLYPRPKFEEGEVLSYFNSRRMTRTWVQSWLVLQGLLFAFQIFMYSEVSFHSSLYDSTVHKSCNEDKPGSCKGHIWRNRVDQTIEFGPHSGHSLTDPIPIAFQTIAWVAHTVQVSVIPDPPDLHFPFELHLKRSSVGTMPERSFFDSRMTGFNSVFLTSFDHVNGSFIAPHSHTEQNRLADWSGQLRLVRTFPVRYTGRPQAAAQHLAHELRSARVIVNEMNQFQSDLFKRKAPQCDLEKSWNSVMIHATRQDASRLSWIRSLLFVSILASALVTYLVWAWQSGKRASPATNFDGVKFHYLVAAKGILQDLPMQAIVLWYICSWYEGGGGEQCQLCMLDLMHCEHTTPFHWSNFFLVAVLLASAVSNQFLFTADPSQLKTEDDAGFVIFIRVMLGCLTILPFSTAMVAFNGSLLQLPGFFHSFFLLPCFAGWVALFSLICFPLTTVIDDDEYFLY